MALTARAASHMLERLKKFNLYFSGGTAADVILKTYNLWNHHLWRNTASRKNSIFLRNKAVAITK